jgi:ATP adenylyltransferase
VKKLWAPWRSRYIRNLDKKTKVCVFCVKPRQKKDRKNYIIRRGRYCYAILNIYPYNNGHVMVNPYRHGADLSRLRPEEILEMMQLVCEIQEKLRKKMKAAGFNIGLNIGRDGGAGFNHLHMHIIPRWRGDTNFMPILTNTKVVSESLGAVYNLLK